MHMRGVLFGASGKPHMLVLEPKPLRSDTWKPKEELRLGPRGLSGSMFCVCGLLSTCLHGGSCSDLSEYPC